MNELNPLLPLLVSCERLATLALIGLAARAAWAISRRADLPWAVAFFVVAALARWSVPWVPSNFYSDLPTALGAYRANERYANPFYDWLAGVSRSPDAVFVANIVVGACSASMALLALRPDDDEASPAGATTARLVALGLALHPLYVRTSASDAPHTWGLALFGLGALCAAHHRLAGARTAAVGVGLAVYLVGATRGELGPAAAVLLGALALRSIGRPPRSRAKAPLAAALVVGTAMASWCTVLARFGFLNGELRLSAELIGQWARGLPTAALLRGDIIPDAERLGMLLFVAAAIVGRRPWGIVAYAALLPLATAVYAVEAAFASSWATTAYHPMMRYALLWQLLPLYFAAQGFTQASERLSRHAPPLARAAGLSALLIVTTGTSVYHRGTTFAFQAEHRFLRDSMAVQRDARPIVVGWRKNAGGDLVEALASPYQTLRAVDPRRRWITYDGSLADLRRLNEREQGAALFFFGALAAAAEQPAQRPTETASLLRDIAYARCVVERQGRRVAARRWLVPSTGRLFEGSEVALRTELWEARLPLALDRWREVCGAPSQPSPDAATP